MNSVPTPFQQGEAFVETIVAIATPPGNGGVGVIRISGAELLRFVPALIQKTTLPPRVAVYSPFFDAQGQIIDSGIALFFPAPHSYTGEDVIEIQAHGGAVILDMLVKRVLALGARLARAGEFTERAFLNNKLDLAQAEAVADLINSSTEQSARSAQKSMQGVFSAKIHALVEELTQLRIYVEAAIDFVDEDIDFLNDGVIEQRLRDLIQRLAVIQATAQQGQLLRDGMTLVLAGKPNAGKSSLLNVLAGHDAAIVADVAGTTRDVLRERIQLDGMPLHIIDTAGLHDAQDVVEREGIRRARVEMAKADKILLLIDARELEDDTQALIATLPPNVEIIRIYNKIDLIGRTPSIETTQYGICCYVSIKQQQGLELLTTHLKESMGFNAAVEDVFIARRRHLEALNTASACVLQALSQLTCSAAGELVAEDLRQAQQALAEITGEFTSDDLLGRIFSSFCIGK
ncbi:MAG TPA: tRNA uridine-5-carboxymethylaminomethyl(34) synthesis GTPase MnmE [Methylococcaceae bacterium]|nr:tRNA uridine-5-carboxymethylaminomethyl(34) synthesis GTPase MnmE [Methylococcaceae bacterium]